MLLTRWPVGDQRRPLPSPSPNAPGSSSYRDLDCRRCARVATVRRGLRPGDRVGLSLSVQLRLYLVTVYAPGAAGRGAAALPAPSAAFRLALARVSVSPR